MHAEFVDSKMNRILTLQRLLLKGLVINKRETAQQYHVTEKTVQRDIDLLRSFFAEQPDRLEIFYDAKQKGYRLIQAEDKALSNSEVYAVCKILLESKAMVKEELFPILDKLVENCAPRESLLQVQALISNERFHYIPPQHGRAFVSFLWQLSTAVCEHQMIEMTYQKTHGGGQAVRRIKPVGILFGEYYFYLAAYIDGIDQKHHFANPQDNAPTIYRIDKILAYKLLDEKFDIPYKDRFQEGEMRKRIQFMYGGKLEKMKFVYTGPNLEAVLDRLPTARVLSERVIDAEGNEVSVPQSTAVPVAPPSNSKEAFDTSQSGCALPPAPMQETLKKEILLEAEVFGGSGFDMWLRSQGDWVKQV